MSIAVVSFFGFVGYIFGLYLTYHRAWEGPNHWACRRCGYDVRGLTDTHQALDARQCPECGVELIAGSVVLASDRHSRRLAGYLALGLVVICSVVLGVCGAIWLLPWLIFVLP